MNILYINHYAGNPALGMEFRPYHLAREWVRSGHAVLVIGATYSHVRARQPVAGDEQVDGISYRWLPAPPYQGNGPGRVWNIASFLSRLWAQTGRLVREFRPDVVIASSTYPMDFWVARRIARRAAALLVHEVHDLWPLSPIELSGMSPRHPFIRLCQAAENAACRDADRVVSILPKVHAHLAAHGLDLAKLVIVPNGITPADWQAGWQGEREPLRADVAAALANMRAAGRVVVGYTGSMGLANALDVLLDAAARLRDTRLSFLIVGDGHERERLVRRLVDESLNQVVWLPPVPKAQMPALLAAIDIAYLGWLRVPIYRFGIAPNKLMDYMAAGCVVLHSVEAGNDPVVETGCGLSVPPESPEAVAAGLLQLAALSAAERASMGRLGQAHVMAHHSWPVLAARFLGSLA